MDQFDHHSQDFAQHWRDIYVGMRQHCPVAHSDRHGGFSVLTRYDDIKKVLADPETFVSGRELSFGGNVVNGGATVQPTRVHPPVEVADCHAPAGTTACGRSPAATLPPSAYVRMAMPSSLIRSWSGAPA